MPPAYQEIVTEENDASVAVVGACVVYGLTASETKTFGYPNSGIT